MRDIKVGDTVKRQLPKWICNGETVVVTVSKILKNDFNFHDFYGEYRDKQGKLHYGKFYFKDCIL